MTIDWRTGEEVPRAEANRALAELRTATKSYSTMTEAQKLVFHTEVYAFRAVFLDRQEETSPCDPKGEWFNRDLVMQLTRTKYSKRETAKRERAAARAAGLQREGRDIVNKWAQEHGFDDLDAYCDANHTPWVDVYTEIVQQICASTEHESGQLFPRRLGRWRLLADCIGGGGKGMRPPRKIPIAEALGVTATEFKPSAEEMAAGRRALDLE